MFGFKAGLNYLEIQGLSVTAMGVRVRELFMLRYRLHERTLPRTLTSSSMSATGF
jgi:hypothetical protein